MEKFQGIFDQGFSGIYDSSTNRKTMPDFLEKLAESEDVAEPTPIEPANISFEKNMSLTRADDLTSSAPRDVNVDNRFTIEKQQREASDNKFRSIDKEVEVMLQKNASFEEVNKTLLSKYPKENVNKYLEAKIALFLDSFSFLGFKNIDDKKANILEQLKEKNEIKRAFVTDMLKKFSKLEYISNSVVKNYKDLLDSQRPLKVASTFLFSLKNIKNEYYKTASLEKSTFARDVDEKNIKANELNNNSKYKEQVKKQSLSASMMSDYKTLVTSCKTKNEIAKTLAKTYGLEQYEKFASIYASDLNKVHKFYERQSFHTDFASAVQEGVEVKFENKVAKVDTAKMLNYAFNLMSNGIELDSIKKHVANRFGKEATEEFLYQNETVLQNHYGQLGYVYIDSNIYSSCDEMKNEYSKMKHVGKNSIMSIKANSTCRGCTLNKKGECQKLILQVSNNPTIRSSRAVKRLFDKVSSFLPESYIKEFESQIKSEDSNKELVSKFTLGMNKIYKSEKEASNKLDGSYVTGIDLRINTAKEVVVDLEKMLNYSFKLMSTGIKLSSLKEHIVSNFGKETTEEFLKQNEDVLSKHYGQLGYTYIDSNIYSDCNEMKEEYSKIQHVGSKLISNVKSNSKCKTCTFKKENLCQKVELVISENPIVRSSRAAKQLFNKAASFAPKSYIEQFETQIKSDESNKDLVSKFTLGIKKACDGEQKNIGKTASQKTSNSMENQEIFTNFDSFNIQIGGEESTSKIIDSIFKE
jgi:hypothetical protein